MNQSITGKSRVIAIANQKGGVGKTTTAVNLSASLATAERKTLLIDADPQGNSTSGVGIQREQLDFSLYDVLLEGRSLADTRRGAVHLPLLDVVPATQDLVGAELELVGRPGREQTLRRALAPLRDEYAFVVVDCPPSLGLLTLNVLTAADAVIIPIQCEYYALEGLSQLLNTIKLVQRNFNPSLAIDGVLLTMFDARLNLCKQVATEAKEYFGSRMFAVTIPRNVRLAEAPSFGKPIILYDVQSVGARSYLAVAQELIRRVERASEQSHPSLPALPPNALSMPEVPA
jgi:chromosome partitioning protein